MSERKKFRSVFSIMLAVFLLPFFVICASAFGLPAYFKSTFLGELSEKYDRLRTVDEPKITVVGGSSIPRCSSAVSGGKPLISGFTQISAQSL